MKYRASTSADIVWFCHETSYRPTTQFGGITAYDDNGLQAMVGLDFWTPTSVHIHIAIKNPHALRGLWREVLTYLTQHGKKLIIGMTPSHLLRALRIPKGLGFKEVYRIRDGWNVGSDIVITEYRLNEHEQSVAA